ncbi:MAG: DUF4169 family protein [Rhodospirillales bacterium]|nr:DUF4169 family protein [Rhodospirillales bacterium]
MADVVNLNQFRKGKTRADQTKKAHDNRIKFGRSKADKDKDEAAREKHKRELDGKIITDNSDD